MQPQQFFFKLYASYFIYYWLEDDQLLVTDGYNHVRGVSLDRSPVLACYAYTGWDTYPASLALLTLIILWNIAQIYQRLSVVIITFLNVFD